MITTDLLSAVPATPEAPAPPAAPETAQTPQVPTDPWKAAAEKVKALGTLTDDTKKHWETQPRDDTGKWTVNEAGERVPVEEPAATATDATTAPALGTEPVTADGETPAEEPGDAAPEPITLTLPNLRSPDGEPIAIDTDDPEVAETVRALTNAYSKREEVNRRLELIERRELDQREVETMIRQAPEMLLDSMNTENRQRFVLHALVNHFDEFRPLVTSWLQDDIRRREDALALREQSQTARGNYQRSVAEARQAHAIEKATMALVPWSATSEDVQDFRRVALLRLSELAEAGQTITTETLPRLLARDLSRFGWLPSEDGTPSAVAPTAPVTPSLLKTESATASPVGARPAPVQAATSPTPAQRKAAAAVTPGGGAAVGATQFPAPKTMADASRLLRQIDPATWKGLR
ncbi:MAG TPA: hypothetical protein VN719_11395 [Gemmatimonadales bacterium]|nr:hypothetical protein [Gemmatimonadales bacterium]